MLVKLTIGRRESRSFLSLKVVRTISLGPRQKQRIWNEFKSETFFVLILDFSFVNIIAILFYTPCIQLLMTIIEFPCAYNHQ
jgi:hypothetical protein